MAAYKTTGRLKSRIPEIEKKLPIEINIATREGAEEVARVARFLVPKNTGRLMESIHVERSYDRGRVLTWVVAWSREAWYGHLVEWGSTHRRGSSVWTIPARPFMVPAAEAARTFIPKEVNEAIRRAVE